MKYSMILRHALVLTSMTACAANTRIDPAPSIDLTGTWVLNEQESSAAANLSTAMRDVRDVRDELPASRAPDSPPSLQRALALVQHAIDTFTIAYGAETIEFGFGDRTVAVVPDWRAVRTTWSEGDSVEVRARWDNGRLRVERRLADSIIMTEYYSRGPGVAWLVLYTVVRGPAGAEATTRRVYSEASSRSSQE